MKSTTWSKGYLFSVIFTCVMASAEDPLVKKTAAGLVRGYASGATVVFKGIPYATPPVGKLRWKDPQPVAAWQGIKKVHYFEPECAQLSRGGLQGFVWSPGTKPYPSGSENCLFVNVWAPTKATSNNPVPVQVFFHGGSNNLGNAGERLFGSDLYDGELIATRTNTVVVTLNYRLGAFGFLAHPQLSLASGQGSGNYGIKDQRMALQWVQQNIGSFGGDNTKVMLFGESAGALDSLILFTSPAGQGLFSRLLLQSVQFFDPLPSQKATETQGQELARSVGCDTADAIACLEGKTMEEILAAKLSFNEFTPGIDGYFIKETPEAALLAGRQNKAALVIGANADELSYIWPHLATELGQKWPPTNEAEYHGHLDFFFSKETAEQVKSEYPLAAFSGNAVAAEIQLAGDYAMVCPFRRFSRATAKTQREPVFQYFYTHVYAASRLKVFGASHGFELPLVFGNFPRFPYSMWVYATEAERKLSESLIDYWARFAAHGDPNAKNLVEWPEFEDGTNLHLRLDETILASGADFPHCDFWDKHRYSMMKKLP